MNKKLSFIFALLFFVIFFSTLFFLRQALTIEEKVADTSFVLIVLPDTQFYSAEYPEVFISQTKWVAKNKEEMKIVFVSHTGDIVNLGKEDRQWQAADKALSLLDGVVPYGLLPGNHDNRSKFNQYFPYTRYENQFWWGGHYGKTNDNNYQLFTASGFNFVILHLEYDPSDKILAWADKILASYPSRKAIVASHYILDYDGFRGKIGQRIFKALKDKPNLSLMLSSHIHGESRRTDFVKDRPIHQLLANYQARANGGNGWLRIIKFVPEENKIYVKTYSPYLDKYKVDGNSQFELDYNL